jgi:hypothetical protein
MPQPRVAWVDLGQGKDAIGCDGKNLFYLLEFEMLFIQLPNKQRLIGLKVHIQKWVPH